MNGKKIVYSIMQYFEQELFIKIKNKLYQLLYFGDKFFVPFQNKLNTKVTVHCALPINKLSYFVT